MPGAFSRNRIMLCAAGLLLGRVALAQQALQADHPRGESVAPNAGAPVRKPAEETPKLTEAQKLAFSTLEVSAGASRGFEAPMRTYALFEIGSTFVTLDAGEARALLREAFTASLEILGDDNTKARMQLDIFRTLAPLSPPDAEELLLQADSRVRNPIAALILGHYAQKKQLDKGLELLHQIAAVDEFPYGGASLLMEAMPPEMAAEKQALFTQALASYKSHEHPDTLIGGSTFTGMVGRFGLAMPPRLGLQAIDEILSQARAKADHEIRLAGPGGSARFSSDYQYQLFALLPTLRKLDEGRAKALLDENQDLQAKMQQFPEGWNSLMPPAPQGAGNGAAAKTPTGNAGGAGGPRPVGAIQDYLRQDTRAKIDAIVQEAESDPVQAIAHSMTLPLELDDGPRKSSPRAEALESIARANVKKNPGRAEAALAEMRKVIADLLPRSQVQYLSSAADLYLQMDDKDKADKVVSEGFKLADALLEQDANPDSPNKALKAWWPSTDAYRRFVEIEARISDRAALGVLQQIQDPEIRTVESIMFARSLLVSRSSSLP